MGVTNTAVSPGFSKSDIMRLLLFACARQLACKLFKRVNINIFLSADINFVWRAFRNFLSRSALLYAMI